MSYTSKNHWVKNDKGELLKGLKNDGIVVAVPGEEIDGELAIDIERMENQTKKIPQMDKADTKAVAQSATDIKVQITEEKPKLKAKNVKSK